MDPQELSDEDVFGKSREMSDADVFGAPAPEPLNMKGFKQRLSDLWERGRIDPETAMASSPELRVAESVGKAAVEGFKTGFGEEEIGLSDEQKQQINDLGLSPGQTESYRRLAQGFKYGAVLFRGLSGLYRGAQEASVAFGLPKEIAQMPDAFMGSPHPTGIPKPTEAASISRVVADRDGTPRVQHIGELPTPADFKGGAEVLSRPAAQPRLVVARRMPDGEVRYGRPGELHSDLLSDGEYQTGAVEKQMGFAVSGGPFLTREQALTDVAKNEPSVKVQLDQDVTGRPPVRLEALHYKESFEAAGVRAAPTLVEKNLRELWDERGIHPAEVVHDAQSDALLRQDVAPPSFEAYHGSPNDFAEFDVSKTNAGIELGSAERASGYTHGQQGTLYKVTVNTAMENFLDRGKSIEQQSEPVRNAVAGIKTDLGLALPDDATGADFYFALSRKLAGDDPHLAGMKRANDLLRERNVPGIHDGPDAINVFDDKLLQITEKNGVPFKPTRTAPVQNTPMPRGTPRSELARTGEPHIDAILDDPITKRNIDEAVINDQYDVPYSAGGSTPMHDPTMYIDRHFPRSMEVDGVRFDPAEPFTIHENVEQHVMEALIKGGMDHAMAYRVAHFEFAEKAEGAWYLAHGIDQAKAEAAYRPFIDAIQHENPESPPPNLYADPYPHDDVRAAKGEPLAEPGPSKAEIAQAKEILAREPKPVPGGADVTRDMPDTPLTVEPVSPPGRSAGAAVSALDQLNGWARNVQYMFDPMATGSKRAMVIAKDAISMVRRIRWDHLRIDRDLVKRFEPEQRKRMWDAADEESVALQLGESREHLGLVTLEPEERALVESLHERAQSAWLLARDAGIVEGDGLPAYTPRMVLNVASATDALGPRALNELGRNVFTRTAQLKRRGHMTAEETEAAAKELVGRRMAERGASMAEITEAQEKVTIARDIRALALATARLEEASVWRTMINEIEMAGKSAGEPTVAVGFKPNDEWFTVAGHPAFTRWEPLLEKVQDLAGKSYWQPVLNSAGEPVFQQKPIYMHKDFKGPMMAILDQSESQSKVVQTAQSAYGALMALKGKSMSAILNSPLIHSEVVWSKVMEAAGGREWLGFGLYWRGNRIVNNPGRAGELIERGLQPMGPRGAFQDITSMMENPDITKGHHPSWTGKVLGFVPGLFDEAAGVKVESAIAKAGDFWHNTLLWDRVRDVQFGLADFLSDKLVAEGRDRLTADRIAAHFSNIVVGSIPKESMSAAARSTANMLLFSRSFTLGNLATYKQAVMGLPKPILAQIERDFAIRLPEGTTPEDMAAALAGVKKDAQSIARRKAAGTIALSAAFFYAGNAVFQHAFNIVSRDATMDEETKAYARRFADLMADTSEDPFELRHLVGRLSPTYDNEPKKSDRIHIGYDKDGTAIYARLPTGKYGEEVVGYPTMPMEMLRRKLSPMADGLLDVLENDKGFGRKIYDENDTSAMGDVKTAFAVAKHMVMKHLPEGQINAAVDLLRGDGDPTVNKYRLFGPVFGFTASVGAPGGQARGEQLAAKQQFDARFNLAWPDIRRQVLRGDSDGAREALTGVGVPPRMQEGLIRNALNPSGALRGGTLRNFYQYSTPQQRERFERAQGRSGSPVPPEMPQLEMPQ